MRRNDNREKRSFETLDTTGHFISKDDEKFRAEKKKREERYNENKKHKYDKWDKYM